MPPGGGLGHASIEMTQKYLAPQEGEAATRVNHVANEDEECSEPVELAQLQNRLFLLRGCEAIRNF